MRLEISPKITIPKNPLKIKGFRAEMIIDPERKDIFYCPYLFISKLSPEIVLAWSNDADLVEKKSIAEQLEKFLLEENR
ncbi:MAG TPA: hypothetical protein ENG63_04990 [Candidatus Desulfofervidus auxilii]|uniref:Uncharacterized protein n=1 Tax=Desulfofervidus auxilii TaxID=1621989 RepID=A0A7C0U2H7_DESA2|nr:hypothetical protein [Candidatus Desulfofervidus auxilii]